MKLSLLQNRLGNHLGLIFILVLTAVFLIAELPSIHTLVIILFSVSMFAAITLLSAYFFIRLHTFIHWHWLGQFIPYIKPISFYLLSFGILGGAFSLQIFDTQSALQNMVLVNVFGLVLYSSYLKSRHIQNNTSGAIAFVILFPVFLVVCSKVWMMSAVDIHSSLTPWRNLVAGVLYALAFFNLWGISTGVPHGIQKQGTQQDLSTYTFALSLFWCYLWYSEYMLINYSARPEELSYAMSLKEHVGNGFYLPLIFHTAVPFVLLLSKKQKTNHTMIKLASWSIIIGGFSQYFIQFTSLYQQSLLICFAYYSVITGLMVWFVIKQVTKGLPRKVVVREDNSTRKQKQNSTLKWTVRSKKIDAQKTQGK